MARTSLCARVEVLRLLHPDGSAFDRLLPRRAGGKRPKWLTASRKAWLRRAAAPVPAIRRKRPEQAETERQRLLKDAKKRGKTPDPRSLQAAQYILLLTSLPASTFSAADVLALYRFRWQLELAFKRMKSLAGLDELAAKKPELARAWIYARLISFLIAERSAGQVPDSSPSGPAQGRSQPIRPAAH